MAEIHAPVQAHFLIRKYDWTPQVPSIVYSLLEVSGFAGLDHRFKVKINELIAHGNVDFYWLHNHDHHQS